MKENKRLDFYNKIKDEVISTSNINKVKEFIKKEYNGKYFKDKRLDIFYFFKEIGIVDFESKFLSKNLNTISFYDRNMFNLYSANVFIKEICNCSFEFSYKYSNKNWLLLNTEDFFNMEEITKEEFLEAGKKE